MLFERLKQSKEFGLLSSDIGAGNVSHAYILYGQDAHARRIYANLIAKRILCPNGACDECPTCKKIDEDVHTDVKYYENKGGKLKVEDAKNIIEDTYIKGWESGTKIYFIDNAEQLTPQVQNKLLKIYEDPPKGVVFILLAGQEGGLLQTVLSRAKKIYLPLFSTNVIFEELLEEGYDRRSSEVASAFSGGRFDIAYNYVDNKSYSDLYDMCFYILTNCKKSSDIPEYTSLSAFSKENISSTIEIFSVILRDVLIYVTKSKIAYSTLNRDYDIEQIGKGFSAGGIAMALKSLANAQKMLVFYVSAQNVADRILFDILEAKYKWQ